MSVEKSMKTPIVNSVTNPTTHFPSKVSFVEVGAREELQKDKANLSAKDKLHLAHVLNASGMNSIDSGQSFHTQWVHDMVNSVDIST